MLAEQGEDGARGAQDDKDEVRRRGPACVVWCARLSPGVFSQCMLALSAA